VSASDDGKHFDLWDVLGPASLSNFRINLNLLLKGFSKSAKAGLLRRGGSLSDVGKTGGNLVWGVPQKTKKKKKKKKKKKNKSEKE